MSVSTTGESDEAATSNDEASEKTAFRLARLVYGGILVLTGLSAFRNVGEQSAYAESKGIPSPEAAVVGSHGLLLLSGIGISLWRLPALAASAAITFFAGVTPTMHDFWNHEGQERQNQRNHFLKNAALAGAALAFLGVAEREK